MINIVLLLIMVDLDIIIIIVIYTHFNITYYTNAYDNNIIL